MASVLRDNLLKFNSDTLDAVRKEFKLDEPGAMAESVNILHEWVQQQEYFVRKDFDKEYLERFIISAKGSVEKAKTRLTRLCTMRSTAPNLFEKCQANVDLPKIRDFFLQVMIPELTEDNYRILCSKMFPTEITSASYLQAYQHCVMICEYMKLHDYAQGYYLVIDLNDVIIKDLVFSLNLFDFRNILTLIIEGYGIRIGGIYIITSSKMIDMLVKIVKQIVSEKIKKRINVVKSMENLHAIFPKRLLPQDFGGEQKPIMELFDELNEELSTESHVSHMKKMREARADEKLRRSDKLNEDYIGMPDSIKYLNID